MLDLAAIQSEIDAGYIAQQFHPTAGYRILNYTQRAQFDWHWTPATLLCRGLILDSANNIVARPFTKFFSYEQLNGQLPDEPFEVYDKLDGSLGILYWIGDEPFIATRGSFVSDQAVKATEILHRKYRHLPFQKGLTYCFEIIYPQNRIVVDYGDQEDLHLLAVIDNATGKDAPVPHMDIPTIRPIPGNHSVENLLAQQDNIREGFVLKFASGTCVKIKFEEYKRLHKLLTGVNERHIWETLAAGKGLDDVLDRVPDEYYVWITAVLARLRGEFAHIENICKQEFQPRGDRRETAEYFKTCTNPSVLFSMLDGKDYAPAIWKMIKPTNVKPFRRDEES